MNLKILGSGSSGNCYLLESSSGQCLMVECGLSMTEIKKGLNFNLAKVVGCIITHEHQDHCKAACDIVTAGIDIYCSNGTYKGLKDMPESTRRIKIIRPFAKYVIGEFTIIPFDVKHDCNEPLGFIIDHKECGRIMFVTDSYYVGYTFPGINNMLVEANYCPDIVKKRMESGNFIRSVRDRVLESHMSIVTCLSMIKANNITKVNNIVLIHLSDGNSHAEQFKTRVEKATGKTVFIAGKGMIINFDKQPF